MFSQSVSVRVTNRQRRIRSSEEWLHNGDATFGGPTADNHPITSSRVNASR